MTYIIINIAIWIIIRVFMVQLGICLSVIEPEYYADQLLHGFSLGLLQNFS